MEPLIAILDFAKGIAWPAVAVALLWPARTGIAEVTPRLLSRLKSLKGHGLSAEFDDPLARLEQHNAEGSALSDGGGNIEELRTALADMRKVATFLFLLHDVGLHRFAILKHALDSQSGIHTSHLKLYHAMHAQRAGDNAATYEEWMHWLTASDLLEPVDGGKWELTDRGKEFLGYVRRWYPGRYANPDGYLSA